MARAAQVILAAIEGTRLGEEERIFFRLEPVAGVTLFRRNVPALHRDILSLLTDLCQIAPDPSLPLAIAIDQEGGRVRRFPDPFPNLGPAERLAEGRSDADALTFLDNYGASIGHALRALGVNVNFAPVVDILTEPTNEAIGDRVFGRDPDAVVARAGAFLRGMQSSGVQGCLKHFPGQGDAKADTHKSGAVIASPREVLENREWLPFKALLPSVPMVMISHVTYPALDPDRPASLSRRIMTDLLRKAWDYQGVIVSDDMNMEAIGQDDATWGASMVEAIAAGADLILVCRHLAKCRLAVEVIDREAARSSAFADRLADAARRVGLFRQGLCRLPSKMT